MSNRLSELDEATLRRMFDLRGVRERLSALARRQESLAELSTTFAELEALLLKRIVTDRAVTEGVEPLTVAVVGDFSSGKSKLINALLGDQLCPVQIKATTSCVTYIQYGETEYFEQENADGRRGKISRAEYVQRVQYGVGDTSSEKLTFHVRLPSPLLHNIRLVDTPGFENPNNEKEDRERTERAVLSSDALLVTIDSEMPNPGGSLTRTLYDLQRGRGSSGDASIPALLLLTKADKQPDVEARAKARSDNERKHAKLFRKVRHISADQLVESAGAEPEVLGAIRSELARVEHHVLKREPFQLGIRAERAADAYRVEVGDGPACALSASGSEDLLDRAGLLELLREVTAERATLISGRTQRHAGDLQAQWASTMAGAEQELERALSVTPAIAAIGVRITGMVDDLDTIQAGLLETSSGIFLGGCLAMRDKFLKHGGTDEWNMYVSAAFLTVSADKRWSRFDELPRGVSKDQTLLVEAHRFISSAVARDAGVAVARSSARETFDRFQSLPPRTRKHVLKPSPKAPVTAYQDRVFEDEAERWAGEFKTRYLQPAFTKLRKHLLTLVEARHAVPDLHTELSALLSRVRELKEQTP